MFDMLGVEGVLAYLDDLLIHTDNFETHLKLLKLVFQAHQESGEKLNAEKTCLLRTEVEHFINAEGIKLVPSYVQKLLDWPNPATGKELSAFLGFAGYYGEFPWYAHVTANLNEVKKKRSIMCRPYESNYHSSKGELLALCHGFYHSLALEYDERYWRNYSTLAGLHSTI